MKHTRAKRRSIICCEEKLTSLSIFLSLKARGSTAFMVPLKKTSGGSFLFSFQIAVWEVLLKGMFFTPPRDLFLDPKEVRQAERRRMYHTRRCH